MSQQVNLLAPIFRKPRTLFTARVAAMLALLLGAGLALGSGWASWRNAGLASEQARLEQRRDEVTAQITELGRVLASRQAAGGDAELARLTAERDHKAQSLALLASRDLGSTRGFSGQLSGLARQHVDGLWLTRVEFAGTHMALTGVALEESLVPRYLKLLGSEPVFEGTAFAHARLERAESGAPGLRFELRTRAGGAS